MAERRRNAGNRKYSRIESGENLRGKFARRENRRGRPVAQKSESRHSMMTVDWPVISNRLRHRIFLQAIMSSLRTM